MAAASGTRILFTYIADGNQAITTMQQLQAEQQRVSDVTGQQNVVLRQQIVAENAKGEVTTRSIWEAQSMAQVYQNVGSAMMMVGNTARQVISVYTSMVVWDIRRIQYQQQLLAATYRLDRAQRDLLIVNKQQTNVSIQAAAAMQSLYQAQLKGASGFNDLRIAAGDAVIAVGRFGPDSKEAQEASLKWLDTMRSWGENAVRVGAPMEKVQQVLKVMEDSINTGQIPAWDQLSKQIGWDTAKWGMLGTAGMTAQQVLSSGTQSVIADLQKQVTAEQEISNATIDYQQNLDAATKAVNEAKNKLQQANQEMILMGVNIAFAAVGTVGQLGKIYDKVKQIPWGTIASDIGSKFGGITGTIKKTFDGAAGAAAAGGAQVVSAINANMATAGASVASGLAPAAAAATAASAPLDVVAINARSAASGLTVAGESAAATAPPMAAASPPVVTLNGNLATLGITASDAERILAYIAQVAAEVTPPIAGVGTVSAEASTLLAQFGVDAEEVAVGLADQLAPAADVAASSVGASIPIYESADAALEQLRINAGLAAEGEEEVGAAAAAATPPTTALGGAAAESEVAVGGLGTAAGATGGAVAASTGPVVANTGALTAEGAAATVAAGSMGVASTQAGVLASSNVVAAGATNIFAGAVRMLNAAFKANPILFIIGLVIAIGVALYEAYQNCEPFRNAINAIGKTIADTLAPAVKAIGDGLKWLWDNILGPIANFLGSVLGAAFQALAMGIKLWWDVYIAPVFNALKAVWDNVLGPFANFTVKVLLVGWKLFALQVKMFWDTYLKPVFDALNEVYKVTLKPLVDALMWAGKAIGDWIGGALGNTKKGIDSAGNSIDDLSAKLDAFSAARTQSGAGFDLIHSDVASDFTSSIQGWQGTRATGGMIPVKGKYELHPGEVVTPAAVASTGRLIKPAMEAMQSASLAAPQTVQPQIVQPQVILSPAQTPSKSAAEKKESAKIVYQINGDINIYPKELSKPEDIRTLFNRIRREAEHEEARVTG
jgi:hypothetical protein